MDYNYHLQPLRDALSSFTMLYGPAIIPYTFYPPGFKISSSGDAIWLVLIWINFAIGNPPKVFCHLVVLCNNSQQDRMSVASPYTYYTTLDCLLQSLVELLL